MKPPRVVLDTNVVLSALLFGAGPAARVRTGWQAGRFVPLASTATAQELVRVLAYPTFRLSIAEQAELLADFMPWVEVFALSDDPPAVTASFNAFNEWLHEDWGFAYKNMIFGAPYISLMDRDNAVAQLDRELARDVRVVVMRPAPVRLPGISRSLADPHFDPFWARVAEAGITVAMHGGDSGYGRYFADWGEGGDVGSFKGSAWKGVVAGNRAPFEAMAALVCHGLFHRHPRIRVCSIEMGANWVPGLIPSFKRAWGISPKDFPGGDPIETFRRHVWISPFHEDDVNTLKELLGADRLLMGSDWPHAEGLADPTDYVRELGAFSLAEQKLVMRDNAEALSKRLA